MAEGTSETIVKSSPWTTSLPFDSSIEKKTSSFADVMSEQLAIHLSDLEKSPSVSHTSDNRRTSEGENVQEFLEVVPDEFNDAMIAQMLQYELDLEHDELLRRKERHYNGPSKLSVSLSNFRYLHPVEVGDELSEVTDFPEPAVLEDKLPHFNGRGYIRRGKDIITKHDADVCGRRNTSKVMDFPPSFMTGDDLEYEAKLSNRVFNELKVHSVSADGRRHRIKDKKEDESTSTLAVDPKTRIMMYKLVNSGTLEDINGLISTGKEAVIFHANGGMVDETKTELPTECALKVFKTTLNEFRNRDPYIREDYRFQERFSKLNPRKIVRFWAEKEMLNLKRLFESGIPCPQPVLLRKHIIVMSFLGQDQKAAPKLKEAELSHQQLSQAYLETCEIMRRMYNECKLVHADFSEYNLIYHQNKVWVIDVSQSVEPAHPRAMEFLYRDCSNVYNFFSKKGLEKILTIKELFKDITGITLECSGSELTSELLRHETKKEKAHQYNSEVEGANFDYLYEMANRERTTEISAENKEDWEDDNESEDDE